MDSMNDTVICECGKPAHPDHLIDNGMHHLPVCTDCWMDPENIAVEVCVQTAVFALGARLPHDVKFADLATSVVIAMSDALESAFTERSITDDGTISKLVVARWDEWYAA